MSQDHPSPLPRPSEQDSWGHRAADRPTYPPTPPVRPPARWGSHRLAGAAPTSDVSGPGVPAAPAHGAPAPPTFGAPVAPTPRYAPPETRGHGGAARISGLGAAAPVHPAAAPAHPVAPAGYHPPSTPGYAAAGPAPASWSAADAAGPTADGPASQAVQHQIRQAVVHRVQYANALHASHYWDLRRTKPVGPHALLFLYASPDPRFANPRQPYYEIKAASRLFRDGSEVQDLPALLAELCEIADGYLGGGGVFDPVAQMTQAGEPIPAEARYAGVSVSTLLGDTAAEPAGVGGTGIPGRNLVVMSDDTLLVVERPARAHEQILVHSTAPHSSGGGVEYRSWLPLTPEQQVHPAWRWLQHLNRLVLAGQERKLAMAGSTVGRRRR
ncbi:hypothetical protein [Micromonospora sp. I033]